MVWDMVQEPPSERHLWRGFRDGTEPGPVEVAERVLRALERYERKWPKGQELLQLRLAISEIGFLTLERKRRLSPEQVYWGWKRIEKAAEKIAALALDIDFRLTDWAEGLVYAAARKAEQAKTSLPYTHSCNFCWQTAKRWVRGWPFCKQHLPNTPAGRRLRYLAKRLGDGNLRRGLGEYRHRLVEIQQRIGSSNRKESETFNLEKAMTHDPVKNPWWRSGPGIRELFGPDFLYIRYTATHEFWAELKELGDRRRREAAAKRSRQKSWTKAQYRMALQMLKEERPLRVIEVRTKISRSSLSRIRAKRVRQAKVRKRS